MTLDQDILLSAINHVETTFAEKFEGMNARIERLDVRVAQIEARMDQFGFPGKAPICIIEQQKVAEIERRLERHSNSIAQTNRLLWICTGGFTVYLFVNHLSEVLAGASVIAHAL